MGDCGVGETKSRDASELLLKSSLPASRTKLPKVMIHVKVSQSHPFLLGHLAKLGMRLPLEISGSSCKAINEVSQLAHVVVKHNGRSAADLLVQLRHGFEPLRPRDSVPLENPIHLRSIIGGLHGSLRQRPARQVCDRLRVADVHQVTSRIVSAMAI